MVLRNPRRALGYAGILLGVGFFWGALSANVPALSSARPIPFFAHNWAVALPILAAWTALAYVLAKRYLARVGGGAAEGLRLGLLFAAAALVFDAVVVAGIVGEGVRHFAQPVLWLAYALLVAIPWAAGRQERFLQA
ncbi:MAG TPA: hypothetical protein VF211_06870 [Burkholderiales bacterium]